jgi:hypothetical protein
MPATAQVLDIGSHHGLQASTPAVKQKRPKQASTACHASSMRGVTARVRAQGATRQAPEQNFFDQILEGRFERRAATQRVLGLPLHGTYPCVIC